MAAQLGRCDGGGQDRHQRREGEGRQDHQPGVLPAEPAGWIDDSLRSFTGTGSISHGPVAEAQFSSGCSWKAYCLVYHVCSESTAARAHSTPSALRPVTFVTMPPQDTHVLPRQVRNKNTAAELEALGATEVIDVTTEDVGERVKAITGALQHPNPESMPTLTLSLTSSIIDSPLDNVERKPAACCADDAPETLVCRGRCHHSKSDPVTCRREGRVRCSRLRRRRGHGRPDQEPAGWRHAPHVGLHGRVHNDHDQPGLRLPRHPGAH